MLLGFKLTPASEEDKSNMFCESFVLNLQTNKGWFGFPEEDSDTITFANPMYGNVHYLVPEEHLGKVKHWFTGTSRYASLPDARQSHLSLTSSKSQEYDSEVVLATV